MGINTPILKLSFLLLQLNNFIKNYNPERIVSYADRMWSNQDNAYIKLGFNFIGVTQPGYCYFKGSHRFNRFNFTKNKLINEGFDKNKTEHQIMLERGYNRIYNSGCLKYELIL